MSERKGTEGSRMRAQPGRHATKERGYMRDHFFQGLRSDRIKYAQGEASETQKKKPKKERHTHHNPTNAATALASASPTDAYLVFGLQKKRG
jgi:hypothetical protein